MPPSFAVICFLICCFNGDTTLYFSPGLDCFEAISMASFFLLISEYAAPDGDFDRLFTSIKDDGQPENAAVWYQVGDFIV